MDVELFGGKEGLQSTKQRDKEKLQRSKVNGMDIIYFSNKDNLTEKLVHSRLRNYMKKVVSVSFFWRISDHISMISAGTKLLQNAMEQ
ncbi:hypothetical protein ACNPFM_003640 [Vibrio parahaemolyticus]|nr:hypothetical protein [Vibrio parahaemolyticus]EHH2420543.1 hypothetical protein [Vibrio parahaemolyticus]EHK2868503.1 hypothetical protein [Vibrio parahaemolyticus]